MRRGRSHGTPTGRYRSKFESSLFGDLEDRGVDPHYEEEALEYSMVRLYRPDGHLVKRDGSKMYIEAKGYLPAEDRAKMVAVKRCNPGLDIRFVFQRAATKISKQSKTTYGTWAHSKGFKWAEGTVPEEWLNE